MDAAVEYFEWYWDIKHWIWAARSGQPVAIGADQLPTPIHLAPHLAHATLQVVCFTHLISKEDLRPHLARFMDKASQNLYTHLWTPDTTFESYAGFEPYVLQSSSAHKVPYSLALCPWEFKTLADYGTSPLIGKPPTAESPRRSFATVVLFLVSSSCLLRSVMGPPVTRSRTHSADTRAVALSSGIDSEVSASDNLANVLADLGDRATVAVVLATAEVGRDTVAETTRLAHK
ncbi:hypothetical protein COOONC_07134 [Cooperia oncophora]